MNLTDKPKENECIVVGRYKVSMFPGLPTASVHLPGAWHECQCCQTEIYVIDEMKTQLQMSFPGAIPIYFCLVCSVLQTKQWGLKEDDYSLVTLPDLKRKRN